MRKPFLIVFFLVIATTTAFSQKKNKEYLIRTVAFYNLENLFDTINDVTKNDEASPMMELKANRSKVYWKKLDNMAYVISQIGLETAKTSPAIIGVSEIENKTVLEDLVKSKYLKDKNYQIIHYDSPDRRGIDVALLYQQRYFKPINHESYNPNIYRNNRKVYTRNQLLVSGYLDGELIHIIVNHWPSRSGGEAKSSPSREKAAYQNTKILEIIKETDENPKVITMGDFNDDPFNNSLKKVLKAKGNKKNVSEGDWYNPYEKMFKQGLNTLGHRDNINLFDQIIITSPLLDKGEKDFSNYKMYQAKIFNKRFLTFRRGKYKGYPFRSFSGGGFTGGYSDHYPVYMYLIREKK